MKIANMTVDGRACNIRVKIAASVPERMRGLLGRATLADDEALLLVPCRSVHTFGMRFSIDVMFVDRLWRVIAVHREVPPARILFNLRATRTLEMRAGMADGLSIAAGKRLGLETRL
ncbi:DUF192 domain-containing protein [Paraburkholderia rhizosphaerae]|uniref:DUF192 domain-containing protein n=1 Tax=Paraburkholderia rhizosphaerae TaxID=480658 RepID=A0A4R8M3B9_9BURK|nr:DUF192 domain-containing protein [Paraburkholderia rhizosphaerae]TDY54563.1 hypothetical protein BX592_10119 [Paraburkholderia rhizosphaerae]